MKKWYHDTQGIIESDIYITLGLEKRNRKINPLYFRNLKNTNKKLDEMKIKIKKQELSKEELLRCKRRLENGLSLNIYIITPILIFFSGLFFGFSEKTVKFEVKMLLLAIFFILILIAKSLEIKSTSQKSKTLIVLEEILDDLD